jgi:GDP-L-fucose synthase
MTHYSEDEHLNVGCGSDMTIMELASLIAAVVGFQDEITTDPSKPDGVPRKLLDVTKLKRLGWQPRIDLRSGLTETYRWYLDNVAARASDLVRERAS